MEAKMKEVNDHMQNCYFARILHVPDKQLWDQLQATKMEVEWSNQRAEVAEEKGKVEERLQLAKTKPGGLLDAKDEAIHNLKQ